MICRGLPLILVMLVIVRVARSQPGGDSVVTNPALIVTDSRVVSTASGDTAVKLSQDFAPPLDAWQALGEAVANLHVSEGGSVGYGSLFALRGLSNTPYFSDSAVTVYVADIPLSGGFTYPAGLFGFGSATVLPGPQGSRFGRATDGGVVLFEPTDGDRIASGVLIEGYGSFDSNLTALEAHTGDVGNMDAEFCADYDSRRGYINNGQIGVRTDDQANESSFGRLRIRPSPQSELTLELLQTRDRDGAEPLVPLGGPLYEVNRPGEGVTDIDSLAAAVKGSFAFPGATLTTVTSYTDWRMNPYQDLLVLPPALENLVRQTQKSWNEEVHLRSKATGCLQGDLGLWLSNESTENYVDRSLPGLFPIEVSGFEQNSRSSAVLGHATYEFGSDWSITTGLRAEEDERFFTREEQVPKEGLAYVASASNRAVLPRVAIGRRLQRDSHLEFAVAFGMRPGGFSSFTDNPGLTPFQAERSRAFSTGWDSSLGLHSLTIAARAFYIVVGDLQVERSYTATDYFVANAGRAHSDGFEVDINWTPSSPWKVTLDAGVDQTRLDAFTSPTSGLNESGNPIPGAPSYNAGVEATYRSARGWFAAGRLTAVGITHYDELSTSKYTQDSYALLGLRAGFSSGAWTFTLYGENLCKAGYYDLIVPGVNSGVPGAPRTFGSKVALKF